MSSPIGLIAGQGKFPLLFAQEARKNGLELVVIALKNEMNENLTPLAKSVHEVSVAKLDSIIQALKKEGVREAVMAGRVRHTHIFSDLIPDFRAAQLLLKIKDRRADSILAGVADEMEKDGITLLPSITFLDHLLPKPGVLTKKKPDDTDLKNIEFGVKMAMGLSAMDVGQTVVIKRRSVVAVEALEGTDACIRRGAQIGGEGAVVVKSSKPNQDLRFDVPVVGVNTIKVLIECKVRAMAVEAGKTLMLEKDECLKMANEAGLVMTAWERPN